MCVWVVARLPQRLRSMFFEKKNFTPGPGSSSGTLHSNFFQKTLILAFEANSTLSSQNGLFSAFQLIVNTEQVSQSILAISVISIFFTFTQLHLRTQHFCICEIHKNKNRRSVLTATVIFGGTLTGLYLTLNNSPKCKIVWP